MRIFLKNFLVFTMFFCFTLLSAGSTAPKMRAVPVCDEVKGTLRLKQDVLVFCHREWCWLAVAVPGKCSGMPLSIEDYERDPQGWMFTPAYREAYYACTPVYEDIRGVIRAGTRLHIVQAAEQQSQYGPYLLFWAEFEDERFAGTPLGVNRLMLDFWCDDEWPPKPDPDSLEWVSRPGDTQN